MKLEEYSSLKEKEQVFRSYQVINNKQNLEDYLASSPKNTLFRGLSEAKYKSYTSAQRFWLQKDVKDLYGYSYLIFVESLIDRIKNNQILSEYYESLHIPFSDINILCFLQHYGAPSPLLDFTYKRDIALYFASESISYSSYCSGTNEIDNYLSIYSLDTHCVISYFDFYEMVIDLTAKKAKGARVVSKENRFESYLAVSDIINNLGDDRYMLVSPQNSTRKNRCIGHQRFDTNIYIGNINLVAQSGVLLLNASGSKPIRESVMSCVDIHKSLLPIIYDAIKSIEYTKLFPKPEEIAQQALNDALLTDER